MLYTFGGIAKFNIANITKTLVGDTNELPVTLSTDGILTFVGDTNEVPITVSDEAP